MLRVMCGVLTFKKSKPVIIAFRIIHIGWQFEKQVQYII